MPFYTSKENYSISVPNKTKKNVAACETSAKKNGRITVTKAFDTKEDAERRCSHCK